MDLSHPHINLLRAFYRFQVLTNDLAARAVGSAKSAPRVKTYILTLVEKRCLARVKKLETPVGNGPYLYVLAEQGMKFLRDEYGYDMKFYKPPSEWKEYSSNYLMHPLELNKIIIAASKIPGVTLTAFERDFELQANPFIALERDGTKHYVIPDAVLQLTINATGRRRILLLEHEREKHKKKAFVDKLRGLYFVAENQLLKERYNHEIPRIAFTSSTDADHVSWMREQTRDLLTSLRGQVKPDSIRNRMFHFRTVPALQGGDIDVLNTFLEPSWYHPLTDDLYSLLDI